MKSDVWNRVRLGDVCEKIGSGATPRGGKDSYVNEGISLIRSQNVFNSRFVRSGLAFITEQQATALDNVVVQEEDILLNITGASVARCCQVPRNVLPARVNQHVAIIRPNRETLDARFLRFYLTAPTTQAHLLRLAGAGATREALTKGMIENFEVLCPPPPEQRRIAAVLGALDDKIELNRQMNRTLEAMAQAIFKSWFIDFDGHDDLVDSELGPIPRGWDVVTWGSLTTLEYGKRLTGYKEGTGPYPVFGTNGQIGWHTEPLCAHPGVIIGRKGAYRGVEFSPLPFFVIDTAFYLKPKVDLSLRWAFYAISQYDINSMDSGSAIPSTSRDSFYQLRVVYPTAEAQKRFEKTLRPIWHKQELNKEESETLAALRDTLLPKLISGEIRVPEAEDMVEDTIHADS